MTSGMQQEPRLRGVSAVVALEHLQRQQVIRFEDNRSHFATFGMRRYPGIFREADPPDNSPFNDALRDFNT